MYVDKIRQFTIENFKAVLAVIVVLFVLLIIFVALYFTKGSSTSTKLSTTESLNGPSSTMNYQQLEHLNGPSSTMNYQQLEHLTASPVHAKHTGRHVPAGVLHPNEYRSCEIHDVVSPSDPFYYEYTPEISKEDTEGFENINNAELTKIMNGG